MPSAIYYNISGVGNTEVNIEITTKGVSDALLAQLNIINSVWAKKVNNPAYAYTVNDYNEIYNAILASESLAANGLADPTGNIQRINYYMAAQVDLLYKTFESVDYKLATTDSAKLAAINNWWLNYTTDSSSTDSSGNVTYSKVNIPLANAIQAGGWYRSLQEVIQLDYVKSANDLIARELSDLQTALANTQGSIQALTDLQNIYNSVEPVPSGTYGNTLNAANFITVGEGTASEPKYTFWVGPGGNAFQSGFGMDDAQAQWAKDYQDISTNGATASSSASVNRGMNIYNIDPNGRVTFTGTQALAIYNSLISGQLGAKINADNTALRAIDGALGQQTINSTIYDWDATTQTLVLNAVANTRDGGISGLFDIDTLGHDRAAGLIRSTAINPYGFKGDGSSDVGVDNLLGDIATFLSGGLGWNSSLYGTAPGGYPLTVPTFNGFSNPLGVQSTLTQAQADQWAFYRGDLGVNPPNGQLQVLIDEFIQTSGISSPTKPALDPSGNPIPFNASFWTGTLGDQLTQLLDSMLEVTLPPGTILAPTPEEQNLQYAAQWAVDNIGTATTNSATGDVSKSGTNGRLLSAAQVASQSLNSQQQQEVSQTLFVFQELYQSTSGMLIAMNQLISKIAQGIAG